MQVFDLQNLSQKYLQIPKLMFNFVAPYITEGGVKPPT